MNRPLEEALERSFRLGILAGASIAVHLRHSKAFADTLAQVAPGLSTFTAADLGTGGGVPGLPLAYWLADSQWTFVEASAKRCDHLVAMIRQLGLTDRVQVVESEAQAVGSGSTRGSFEVVTARAFGAPAIVAEVAAPLLTRHGIALVSEPPGSDGGRWDTPALTELGLVVEDAGGTPIHGAAFDGSLDDGTDENPPGIVVLRKVAATPDRFPRRRRAMERKPLFG